MLDIGAGFANLKKGITQDDANFRTGLYACKVTVTLNVTASAEAGGGLVVDTTLRPPRTAVDTSATVHLDQTNKSSAQNTNSIAIEMYNPACIPSETVGFNTPDKVDALTLSMMQGVSGAILKSEGPDAMYHDYPAFEPTQPYPDIEPATSESERDR